MEKPVIKLKFSLKAAQSKQHQPQQPILAVHYRPFRLFPLQEPGSLLVVHIPSHSRAINAALPRRALWKPFPQADCYTDDSDAVCIAIAEGLIADESDSTRIPAMKLTFEVCDLPSSSSSSTTTTTTDEREYSSNDFYRLWTGKHDGNFWRLKSHEFLDNNK